MGRGESCVGKQMSERALPVTAEQRHRQAAVLVALRQRAALQQTQAAALIGVSYGQLRRYESGANLLATNYYPIVARVYGVEVADLAGWLIGFLPFDVTALEPRDPFDLEDELEALFGDDIEGANRLAEQLADVPEPTRQLVLEVMHAASSGGNSHPKRRARGA
jgi:transcriptional regulator with XRE-family HTH domain